MKSTIMKRIGTMDNGKYLCVIDREDWERLMRREGVRKNAARSTASIASIFNHMEYVYGLPPGCVRFVKPNGKDKYNRNTRIQRIRNDYEQWR